MSYSADRRAIYAPISTMESERLASKGRTYTEKALAGNYAVGDVVAFRRTYRCIGVGKGDKCRVTGFDHGGR